MPSTMKNDFQARWDAVENQWEDFSQAHVAEGDMTMYRIYVGGVAYSVAEYGAMLFEAAQTLKGFAHVSAPLFPLWNFIDAAGVIVDGGRDYKNGDKASAYINYFSGLQLIAGTSLGVVVRALEEQTAVNPAIGMVGGLTISAGAFAVCMFCSAIVAQIKVKCLSADLATLNSKYLSDKNFEKILSKVVRRNPGLEHLQIAYKTGSLSDKMLIKHRLTKVMEAELKFQKEAVKTWLLCGIAMTCVALIVITPGNILLVAACILMLASAYKRYTLRESEKEQNLTVKINSTPLLLTNGTYARLVKHANPAEGMNGSQSNSAGGSPKGDALPAQV